MTPQEMQTKSREKVQQVMDLAKLLHLECEAKQRINMQTGFIEQVVFWTDNEKYPAADPAGPTGEAETTPEAQAQELGEGIQEMVLPEHDEMADETTEDAG